MAYSKHLHLNQLCPFLVLPLLVQLYLAKDSFQDHLAVVNALLETSDHYHRLSRWLTLLQKSGGSLCNSVLKLRVDTFPGPTSTHCSDSRPWWRIVVFFTAPCCYPLKLERKGIVKANGWILLISQIFFFFGLFCCETANIYSENNIWTLVIQNIGYFCKKQE